MIALWLWLLLHGAAAHAVVQGDGMCSQLLAQYNASFPHIDDVDSPQWQRERCAELYRLPHAPRAAEKLLSAAEYETWGLKGWHNVLAGPVGEPQAELLHGRLSLLRDSGMTDGRKVPLDAFISVVGSMNGLEMLRSVRPRSIIWVDANPMAIMYGKLLVEMITLSNSPQTLLTNLFARDTATFEKRNGRLTVENQLEFMALPRNASIEESIVKQLSDDAAAAYQHLIKPLTKQLQSQSEKPYDKYRVGLLLPVPDRRTVAYSNCRSRIGLGGAFCRMGTGATSYLLYGEMWMQDVQQYTLVRQEIAAATHRWVNANLFDLESWQSICHNQYSSSAIYLMDVISNNQTALNNSAYIQLTKGLADRCGQQKMYFLQGWAWDKKAVCQKRQRSLIGSLIGGATQLTTCSDWDSTKMLPSTFFVSRLQPDGNQAKQAAMSKMQQLVTAPAPLGNGTAEGMIKPTSLLHRTPAVLSHRRTMQYATQQLNSNSNRNSDSKSQPAAVQAVQTEQEQQQEQQQQEGGLQKLAQRFQNSILLGTLADM